MLQTANQRDGLHRLLDDPGRELDPTRHVQHLQERRLLRLENNPQNPPPPRFSRRLTRPPSGFGRAQLRKNKPCARWSRRLCSLLLWQRRRFLTSQRSTPTSGNRWPPSTSPDCHWRSTIRAKSISTRGVGRTWN